MLRFYKQWIEKRELGLATRDTNRQVRPFEWGLDWLELPSQDPPRQILEYNVRALAPESGFYAYQRPADFRLEGSCLTFTSPLPSPYPENNQVHADFFPAGKGRRAVLVLPQWNADVGGHRGLCQLMNKFGLTALRLSMAYHDRRMPPELSRADYHVSSNIGRTIHACRQSILDARACLDWLEQRGYDQLAILGTSLGSCLAFITATQDQRVRVGVFNHVSMYFGDVVWTGLATRHIRASLETAVTQDQLRDYWRVISPAAYLDSMAQRDLDCFLIWARYDSTFLPVYSWQLIDKFREMGFKHRLKALPCGHYTTGQFPFNWMDGLAICRFLAARL